MERHVFRFGFGRRGEKPLMAQPDGITVESSECTDEKYGYCEQQVYVWMMDPSGRFGICQQLALVRHVR
jgi:hypothetical protein